MFHLPNEEDLRTRVNYTEEFTLTLLWNVGLLGIVTTSLFLILLILKQYQLRVARNEAMRQSMLTIEERTSTHLHPKSEGDSESQRFEALPNPNTLAFKIINLLTSLFFYLFWIAASLIYLVFFMFGYFGRGTHIDVISVFVLAFALILPTLLWKHKTKTTAWEKQKRETIFTIVMLILWLGLSTFLVIATKGVCVCYFNDQIGFKIGKDMRISTEFTRTIQLKPPCPGASVCHLYATVPEDASTAVFFNAHAGIDADNLTFTLKFNGTAVASKVSAPFKLDNVESIGQRTVHSVLFSGLTANTIYSLQLSDRSGSILKQANYKTVPGSDAGELRMAVGGDLGMSKEGILMTSYLDAFDPDIIILGGDTTYDDGMRSCYTTWDEFYSMFESINEKRNRIIPLVMSVGNHDVGFDAMTQNDISTTPEELPLFFYFNPQHLSKSNNTPSIEERLSYHYHKIGPTIHFNLDSGYVTDHSDQTAFLRSYSASNPTLYHFANYHNPIYPTCTNSKEGSNDRLAIAAGLQHWTPLFDEFGFVASMEHHTHYRKFTYKIKNNTLSTNSGTRYIGDGSWGVTEQICPDEKYTPKPELIESFANNHSNHMWQITLKKTEATKSYLINYTAINLYGERVAEKVEELPAL